MNGHKTKARTAIKEQNPKIPKNLSLSEDAIEMGQVLQKHFRRSDFSNMVEHLIVDAHNHLTAKKSEAA